MHVFLFLSSEPVEEGEVCDLLHLLNFYAANRNAFKTKKEPGRVKCTHGKIQKVTEKRKRPYLKNINGKNAKDSLKCIIEHGIVHRGKKIYTASI